MATVSSLKERERIPTCSRNENEGVSPILYNFLSSVPLRLCENQLPPSHPCESVSIRGWLAPPGVLCALGENPARFSPRPPRSPLIPVMDAGPFPG